MDSTASYSEGGMAEHEVIRRPHCPSATPATCFHWRAKRFYIRN